MKVAGSEDGPKAGAGADLGGGVGLLACGACVGTGLALGGEPLPLG